MNLCVLQQASCFHGSKQEFSKPGLCPPVASCRVSLGLQQLIQAFRGVYKNLNLFSSLPNWIYIILVSVGEVLKGTNRSQAPFFKKYF